MPGEPSHLRATLRLAVQALRSRPDGAGGRDAVPRRRVAVERSGIAADPRRVAAYLRVTGGEGIARGDGPLPLPPTYPSLWETALALELLALADLPFPRQGIIHLESEMLQLRPLQADDRIRCRVELDRVDEHPKGLRLTLVSRNWNGGGQLCLQDTQVLLARYPEATGGRGASPEGAGEREGAQPVWEEVESWPLRAGHGRRYALISRDFNPIHLWAWSSRLFGYRRPVLHGFCAEAMVAHALISRRLGGDPLALRRIQVVFRSPILLPARVRLEVSPHAEGGGGRFRLVGEEERRPYAEGVFVGAGA